MRRRSMIVAGGMLGAVSSFATAQQQPQRTPKLILVVGAVPGSLAPQGLRHGLRLLGYVESRDITILHSGPGSTEAATGARIERVDAIFAVSSAGVRAALQASPTVPIVAVDFESEPIADGLIRSFARPGGNLTGLFLDQPTLSGKWLELITELLPGTAPLAIVHDPRLATGQHRALRAAADARNIRSLVQPLADGDHETTFRAIAAEGARAAIILSSPRVVGNRVEIAQAALAARIASITLFKVYTEAGGLMSYGPDPFAAGRRAADFFDRIFRGAAAGTLPIEQPDRIEFSLNLATARTLGLAVPPSLLLRADEVIE